MSVLNTTVLQAVSFGLFLASLPLLSFGTMEDQQLLWYAGLAMVVLAGILPPVGRFVVQDEDDDAEADEQPDGEGEEADADTDDRREGDGDARSDRQRRRPPDGPLGQPPAAPGREPHRPRVREQEEHR